MTWLASGWANFAELLGFCVAAGYLSGDAFPPRDRLRRAHNHLCSWCHAEWTAPGRVSRCPHCKLFQAG